MPKNHYGESDPDYDVGEGNRDFTILTTQDGYRQTWPGAPVEVASNMRENMPDEDGPFPY